MPSVPDFAALIGASYRPVETSPLNRSVGVLTLSTGGRLLVRIVGTRYRVIGFRACMDKFVELLPDGLVFSPVPSFANAGYVSAV